jgi:nucleotide-binding universal stress UspA family protein
LEELTGVADAIQFPGVGALGPELERVARSRLEELAGEAASRFDLDVRPLLIRGRAWREILRTAARERPDVVAIGPGHGALEQLLFGSDAHHVVREATCPVLILRPVGQRPERELGSLAVQLRERETAALG